MGAIWDNIIEPGFLQSAKDAFSQLEPWFYPFLIVGIIGFLYTGLNSITVAIVGILITFGILAATTGIFNQIPTFTQFFYIITIIGLTLLFTTLFIKYRRGT